MLRRLCARLIKNCSEYFSFKISKSDSWNYPTRFSELNYMQTVHNIKTSRYSISIRGPYIWNSFLIPKQKSLLCINSKLHQNRGCSFCSKNSHFSWGNFFIPSSFMRTCLSSVLIQQIDCWGLMTRPNW